MFYKKGNPEKGLINRLFSLGLMVITISHFFISNNAYAQQPPQIREIEPIRFDSSPPITPVVNDDGDYTDNNTQLHATWTSQDPQSGICEYRYAIGTGCGLADVYPPTSAGLNTEVTVTGLNLIEGQVYFFSVQAKNCHNVWSDIGCSDGITVDITAPSFTIDYPQDGQIFGRE